MTGLLIWSHIETIKGQPYLMIEPQSYSAWRRYCISDAVWIGSDELGDSDNLGFIADKLICLDANLAIQYPGWVHVMAPADVRNMKGAS